MTEHGPLSERRAALAVGAVGLGALLTALMQSLVIPLQSRLPELLGTTADTASWVVTATLLGGAVAMPIAGRVADLRGKRPVLIATGALMLVGSVVCALSTSLVPVLVGRVLQGMAMGYIPVAISLVREIAPTRMRNGAMSMVSAMLGVGGALGLPLGAWIAEVHDWHGLFWTAAGMAAAMIVLTATVVPAGHDARPGRVDLLGAVGLGIGVVGILVGVTKGSAWGWGSWATVGSLAGGVLVVTVWSAYQLRTRDPLVDLRIAARRPVLLTNIAAVLVGFGLLAQSIVMPQLLQLPVAAGGFGMSMLESGLWMAPGGLTMMAFSPVSARLLGRLGGRPTLAIGAAVLAAGYVGAAALLATGALTGTPWALMAMSCLCSAGVGIGYAAMPSLILANVPASAAAGSVGFNSLMRAMGTTSAGAVMAAVLTAGAGSAGAAHSVEAFVACLVIAAGVAAAGALVALGIRSRPPRQPDTPRAVRHTRQPVLTSPRA